MIMTIYKNRDGTDAADDDDGDIDNDYYWC